MNETITLTLWQLFFMGALGGIIGILTFNLFKNKSS